MHQCLLLTRVCACLLRNMYWFNAHKEPSSSLPLQVRLKCLSVCDDKIICWHWLSLCHWTGKQGWKQVVSEQASSLNKRLLQSGLSAACSHVNAMLPLYIKPVWAKDDSMWLIVSVRLCVCVRFRAHVCVGLDIWMKKVKSLHSAALLRVGVCIWLRWLTVKPLQRTSFKCEGCSINSTWLEWPTPLCDGVASPTPPP